jgi:PKD repeat protein
LALGLLVGAVVLAALPASAGAVLVQAHNGQRYGVFLRADVGVSALRSAHIPLSGRVAKADGNVDYNGGPILHSSAPYLIFWDPSSEITTQSRAVLEQYLSDTAADSGKATNVYSVLRQYTDSTGFADYKQTFSASHAIVDTQAYPAIASGCTTAAGYPRCITDAQLQAEVTRLISAHSLPTGVGPNAPVYFVITPKDTNICAVGGCADATFCAYHSSFTDGSNHVLYASVPFIVWTLNSSKGCQVDGTAVYQTPNSDEADNIADNLSHELSETITDPLGTAWYNAYNNNGNEVGDNCASEGSLGPLNGQSLNAYLPTLGGGESAGTLYDQGINGDHYYTQTEWSNGDVGCKTQTSADTLTPQFTDSVNNTIVSFDPTTSTQTEGSITSVSWDFGDGSTAFSTSSPALISHTYAVPGTYTVTLKLVDSFGNAATVSQSVTADELPTASFTGPASGVAGAAVTFDGGGSSDPDGSITGYSWSFGDGKTSAAGPTTPHTYSAPGTHTVTLTVTDSSGLQSTTSHQVVISAAPGGALTAIAGVGNVKVTGNTAVVTVTCKGPSAATCSVSLQITVTEASTRGKVVAVAAAKTIRKTTVVVGEVTVTLSGGTTRTIQIGLGETGKQLLAKFHKLKVTLAMMSAGVTVSHTTVTFKEKTTKKNR